MAIVLSKEAQQQAAASLIRYFQENFDQPLGNLGSAQLLDYILEEVGPSIYNQAVIDVRNRLVQKLSDLESETFEPEFQYWLRQDRRKKKR